MFKIRVTVVTFVLLVLFTSISAGALPGARAQNESTLAKVALNPPSIANLSLIPGSTVTFQVNTTSAAPYAGYFIGFFYNISVLTNPHVDYTNNVLDAPGNPATVLSECLNGASLMGSGNVCTPDLSVDGIGVLSLQLITTPPLGNTTTPNGKLFSVSFTVATTGFSSIHFVEALLETEPNGALLPVVTNDGYFTNIDCPTGSVNLCKPPIVSFTPPNEIVTSEPESFVASALSENPNGVITEYNWTWGSGQSRFHYDSPPVGNATPSPNATLTFRTSGINQVTLSAEDSYGARAYYSLSVHVLRSEVSVFGFFTDASLKPLPLLDGSAQVEVFLANGVVRSTDPRNVLYWVNVTNTGPIPLRSLQLVEFVPFDWGVSPSGTPGSGAVHVYFANTTSLATNPDITDRSKITVAPPPPPGDRQVVILSIPSLNNTAIGHPLLPGQGILMSVKISYSLVKTLQSPTSYPRTNVGDGAVSAWNQPSYMGSDAEGAYSVSLLVLPRLVEDLNRLVL